MRRLYRVAQLLNLEVDSDAGGNVRIRKYVPLALASREGGQGAVRWTI